MIRILEPGENIDSMIEIARRHSELKSTGPVKGRPLKEMAEQHKGQRLIHMYQSHPWVALHFSALVLNALPTQGAEFGAASRDVGRYRVKSYGAILTDVKDFLKLRFRTKGLVDPNEVVQPYVLRAVETGDMGHVTQTDDRRQTLGYLVDSLINELNTLSRSPNIIADDVMLRLRKSFSGLGWLVNPYQSDTDTLEKMFEVRT